MVTSFDTFPPPSMSMAVKPHQAFFWAARTNPAAGLVPIFARVPAVFPSMLSPPPLSPHPGRGERRRRKHAPLLRAYATWLAVWRWSKRLRSVACNSVRAPGPNDRLSVGNPRRFPAPCTVYAASVRHASSKSSPLERTVPSQVHPAAPRRLSPTSLDPPPRQSARLGPPRFVVLRSSRPLGALTLLRPRRRPASRAAAPSNPPADARPSPGPPPALPRARRSALTRSAAGAPTLQCRSFVSACCPRRSAAGTTGSRHSPAASAATAT